MKYCQKCGTEIQDGTKYCPVCGALVGEEQNKKSGTNGVAIAGLICAFFIPILGWILGGIGYSKAQKENGNGKGIALAAIIVASINFVLGIFYFF